MHLRLIFFIALAAGAPGCDSWLDRLAQRTGAGFDPEGVVHAFLWARAEGRDTSDFWRTPVTDQPRATDRVPERPRIWRALPQAAAASAAVRRTEWRRFAVTSVDDRGAGVESAWDFCLALREREVEPRYQLVEIWPTADDTPARCATALESRRYREPRPDDPPSDPGTAFRIRVRTRFLLGPDVTAPRRCTIACGPTATDRDCDLCICLDRRIASPACDRAAGH
jgi:hypothetical protein